MRFSIAFTALALHVARLARVPVGFLNVCVGLFSMVMVISLDVLGVARLFFMITSGVVQCVPQLACSLRLPQTRC